MSVQAGPVTDISTDTLTHLERLELSLLPPSEPELNCEILQGDEKHFPRDPRPQVACYSNKRGIFFLSFDYEGEWRMFENTIIPSYAWGNMFSTAALLKVVFIAMDGSIAETEILVENSLYKLHCIEPLCLVV